jgi:hypothetical protein
MAMFGALGSPIPEQGLNTDTDSLENSSIEKLSALNQQQGKILLVLR